MSFEIAAHCILNPMLVDSEGVSEKKKTELLQVLQSGLGISDDISDEILKRVNDKDNKKAQAGLMDMEFRYYSIDQHPFYGSHNFKSESDFKLWKKREKASIVEIARFIVMKLVIIRNLFVIITSLKTLEEH
jgi:hypothetical protein